MATYPLPCRFSKDEMKDLLKQSTQEARSGKYKLFLIVFNC